MSERSIAEIIGWTFTPRLDYHHPSLHPNDWVGTWSHPARPDRFTHQGNTPTHDVDDLLAWLQGRHVDVVYRHHCCGATVQIGDVHYIIDPFPGSPFPPTLLAALEAAVRAVAAREEAPPPAGAEGGAS